MLQDSIPVPSYDRKHNHWRCLMQCDSDWKTGYNRVDDTPNILWVCLQIHLHDTLGNQLLYVNQSAESLSYCDQTNPGRLRSDDRPGKVCCYTHIHLPRHADLQFPGWSDR